MIQTLQINPAFILLAGLLAMLGTTALKREHWTSTQAKFAAGVLSAVSGFIAVLAQAKGLNADTIAAGVAGSFGVNQSAYALLRNTKAGKALYQVFNPAANATDANTTVAAEVAATMITTDATKPEAPATPPASPTA